MFWDVIDEREVNIELYSGLVTLNIHGPVQRPRHEAWGEKVANVHRNYVVFNSAVA